MHDKTRSEIEDVIDAIQDLGWDVRQFKVDEGEIAQAGLQGREESKPTGAEMRLSIRQGFLDD